MWNTLLQNVLFILQVLALLSDTLLLRVSQCHRALLLQLWQTPRQVQGLEGQSGPLKLKCQKCCKEFYCRNCSEKVYVQVCMRLYSGQWEGKQIWIQSLNKAVANGHHYNVTVVTIVDKLCVRSVAKWDIFKILCQIVLPMGALCAKKCSNVYNCYFSRFLFGNISFLKL